MTPRYERILPLVGITVMGLSLILLVESIHALTFPISLPQGFEASVSAAWLILFVLLIVVAVGTESIEQRERGDGELVTLPAAPSRRLRVANWIVPMLLVLASFLFLRLLPSFTVRVVGLVLTGTLLFVALVAQYYSSLVRLEGRRGVSHLVQELLVYLIAFLLYGSIYTLRVRSLFSATSIVVLSFLLAFALLHRFALRGRAGLYAVVVGLCVGEITWPLNYWAITGLSGGAFLLIIFYCLVNLAQHRLQESLTWRVAREYVFVALLGMVLIGLDAFVPGWRQLFSFWPR